MNKKKGRFRTLLGYTRGYRLPLFGAFAILICELLLSFANPLVLSVTIDSVLDSNPLNVPGYFAAIINALGGIEVIRNNLWIMSLLMIAMQLISGGLSFLRPCLTSRASEGIVKRLRDDYYSHVQRLPYSYHTAAQTGDLIQRATTDIDMVRRFLSGFLLEFIRTTVFIIVGFFLIASIHLPLTLITFSLMPFIVLDSLLFVRKIEQLNDSFEQQEGKVYTVIQENLTGARVVRAFGRQKLELEKLTDANEDLRGKHIKLNNTLAFLWSSLDVLCGLQIALVSICGIIFAVKGSLSLGQYTAFLSYIFIFLWPIRNFGRVLSNMSKAFIAVNRIEEVMAEPEEDACEGGLTPDLGGDIVFENVSFAYGEHEVLENLSMTIPGGKTIAILGGTGSGKSTLVQLLQRLYDPTDGRITVGGVDITQIKKSYLRDKTGIVMQEPFLYSKTIMQNIGIKQEDPEPEAVYAAASTASIHDDILEFENGYDTIVGERGVTLSGGQKQRVAIARTLMSDSNILIFDDSLSAVDTETDMKIRKSLLEKRRGVTTIIISHRISTLMEADKIFVLKNGQILESGTHDELIAMENGAYRRVFEIQSHTGEEGDE